MKKLLLISIFATSLVFSQNNLNWRKKSETTFSSNQIRSRINSPSKSEIFDFDYNQLKVLLQNAPLRQFNNQVSEKIVSFPNPLGLISNFKVFENPIMENGLANRFQNINTYIGINVRNQDEIVYFSTTDFGLHVMSFSSDFGTYFIDSFSKNNNSVIVYSKKDIQSNQTFECLVNDEFEKRATAIIEENASRASDGKFRQYRLAMACTIEYAAFHVNAAGLNTGTLAQKKAAVLAAMVVTMNRVNGLFEKDMSLKMNLIANNDAIIFIDSDTFDNSTANVLINQSQTVIDATIGAANYDIGHTVSTGGGGVAQLYSPCSSNKARGITGRGAPVGDPFDIDYVAHEMGHQFGAQHTQNNNCNRSASSVEPGSATTIMGYAGICSPNVQGNSDVHFNAISIAEMSAFIAGSGGSCPLTTNNGNFAPVVNAGIDYTIPFGTAFVLEGNATDTNNDSLTYCWEQQNAEPSTQPPTTTATVGPNFRSLPPTSNPNRFMPNLTAILANNLVPTWEVIPNSARTMNFSLTARDNRIPNGGQTGRDNMVLNIANVGPFVITAPNTNVSLLAGSNQVVTWDVAGTTSNGINCAFVDIYFSSNAGNAFPILLASKVPNDGSETVSVPNSVGSANRIMVRGNNSIFFDVTNTNFTVTNPTATFGLSFSGNAGGQNKIVCQGSSTSFDLNYSTLLGFSGVTNLSVTGNPAGSTATFSQNTITANGTVMLTISDTQLVTPGLYTLQVIGTSGAITKTVNLYLEVLNATFATVELISPSNNAFGLATTTVLNWNIDPSATNYDVQVATDDTFVNVISTSNIATNSYTVTGLSDMTNYFWRVLPKNVGCFGTYSEPYRFTTEQTFCSIPTATDTPITIIEATPNTINSTITIPVGSGLSIFDINVTVNITHTYTADVAVRLIAPNGTIVQLINNQCGSGQNINATFDDAGSVFTCGTVPAIGGVIIPAQPLSSLNGLNSAGVWTLRVIDNANRDGGSLNSWSLKICATPDQSQTCGQISTTWNGSSWTNGKPVDNVLATISGNYISTTDFKACALNVTGTSQVTINSGNNLIVKGAVNVASTANLTLQNNANLVQIENVTNNGNITAIRNTSPLKRLDYVNWSSPVTGSQTLKQFSPLTLNNRFYTFITPTNVYEALPSPNTTVFATGKGYLIRMPDNHPTSPTAFSSSFSGIPNNGSIDVNLTFSGLNSYNLVGNPYPSTISAANLLSANATTINGAIYFWRKTNAAAGTAYATYSLGGATTTSPTSPVPNGIIQVGQGFLVEALNAPNPILSFTNSMRVANTSNQFFRFDNSIPNDKFWLNLTNSSGAFSQMLMSYMPNATNGIDAGIDAKGIDDSALRLCSIIENNTFTIQGKAPFTASDSVDLQFKTDVAGDYIIAIDHVEGLFEGNQDIFLKDAITQTTTNLKSSSYTFSSQVGVFNSRFQVVFQQTLASTNFEKDTNLKISIHNETIKIKSTTDMIEKVEIFDLLGRNIFSNKKVSQKEFTITNLNVKNQTLVMKIVLENGTIKTQKIIF